MRGSRSICVLLILIVYCSVISRMVRDGLETTERGSIECGVLAVSLWLQMLECWVNSWIIECWVWDCWVRSVGTQDSPGDAGSPSDHAVVSEGVAGCHTCVSGCPAFCWHRHDAESLQRAHWSPWSPPSLFSLPVLHWCGSSSVIYCYYHYTNHWDQANLSALQIPRPWGPASHWVSAWIPGVLVLREGRGGSSVCVGPAATTPWAAAPTRVVIVEHAL